MANRDLWIKFYPDDWNADIELASCSLAAQGLLARLMSVLHRSEPYAYLLRNGSAPAPRDISRVLGIAPNTYRACLKELLDKGVLREDEMGIYSKRMRLDWEKRQQAKSDGAKGGNPQLVDKGVKGRVKGMVKLEVEENKNKNKNKNKSTQHPPTYTPDFENFWRECPKKVSKRVTFQRWNERLGEGIAPATLTTAMRNYAADCEANDSFPKHPATFIGPGYHYEDYTEGIPDTNGSKVDPDERKEYVRQYREGERNGTLRMDKEKRQVIVVETGKRWMGPGSA